MLWIMLLSVAWCSAVQSAPSAFLAFMPAEAKLDWRAKRSDKGREGWKGVRKERKGKLELKSDELECEK